MLVRLPEGDAIDLTAADARLLVEALWGVPSTQGSVVAIGKIEHRLAAQGQPEVELSDDECGAVRAALERADDGCLTPALASLRSAAG